MGSPRPRWRRREAAESGAPPWLRGLSPRARGRLSACSSKAEALKVLEEAWGGSEWLERVVSHVCWPCFTSWIRCVGSA